MQIREADLDRHLINDKEKEAAKEAAKQESKAQPAKTPGKSGKDKKDENDEEAPVRMEYASKSDYQFQQAVNLLKGLQIMQNKAKE